MCEYVYMCMYLAHGWSWGRREQNNTRRKAINYIFSASFLKLSEWAFFLHFSTFLLNIKPLKIVRNCFYDKRLILLEQESNFLIASGESK